MQIPVTAPDFWKPNPEGPALSVSTPGPKLMVTALQTHSRTKSVS
jgi:hypothetical protein